MEIPLLNQDAMTKDRSLSDRPFGDSNLLDETIAEFCRAMLEQRFLRYFLCSKRSHAKGTPPGGLFFHKDRVGFGILWERRV